MGNITSKYSLKIWNVFCTAFYKDESFVGLLTDLLTVLMDKFLEFSLADFFLIFQKPRLHIFCTFLRYSKTLQMKVSFEVYYFFENFFKCTQSNIKDRYPVLICTLFLKNQFGKIKFGKLDFLSISNWIFCLFRTGFSLPV